MLVVLPAITARHHDDMMSPSAIYGAEVVHAATRDVAAASVAVVTSSDGDEAHSSWEQYRRELELQLLLYIHYHIHCRDDGGRGCTNSELASLSFVGYASGAPPALGPPFRPTGMLLLRPEDVDWDGLLRVAAGEDTRRVGTLPGSIRARLARPWQGECRLRGRLVVGVSLVEEQPCPWQHLRAPEFAMVVPMTRQPSEAQLVFVFDLSHLSRVEAMINIATTVLVALLLLAAAVGFSADAEALVLRPMERMLRMVDDIRQHPLSAFSTAATASPGVVDQSERMGRSRSWSTLPRWRRGRSACGRRPSSYSGKANKQERTATHRGSSAKTEPLETHILLDTLRKFSCLLAVGFGEAGSTVVCECLGEDTELDVRMRGTRVEAIYGYCGIQDFSATMETLQERAILFVNRVASILHAIVDEHLGTANKNLGGAFLLVWHLGPLESPASRLLGPPADGSRSRLADLSVLSFVRVAAAVCRDYQVAEILAHPGLSVHVGGRHRARLSFGLHVGWSIQGAIGSQLKIEASYLSPHVNKAQRLEALARSYDVPILLSDGLAHMCTPRFASVFRPVDRVKIHRRTVPRRLFAVDLDLDVLSTPCWPPLQDAGLQALQRRVACRAVKRSDDFQPWQAFMMDSHIRRMRAAFVPKFFQEFERAYVNYEAGEWDVAAAVLRGTLSMLKGGTWRDGPSAALLEFMERHGFRAPEDWDGHRELTEPSIELAGADVPATPPACAQRPPVFVDKFPAQWPRVSRSAGQARVAAVERRPLAACCYQEGSEVVESMPNNTDFATTSRTTSHASL